MSDVEVNKSVQEVIRDARAFQATRLGSLLARFESKIATAWQNDCNENVSDKRLRDVWGAADAARVDLIAAMKQSQMVHDELVAALKELRDYAASVWCDEATDTDEEREIMSRAKAALAKARE